MDYSRKDFTGRNLTEHKIDPQEIVGSCFSQETPDSEVFPADMQGVTFINCNLMNCKIPEGNTVIDCWTTRFRVQNDGNDWEIDEKGNPLCVMDYKFFYKRGITHPNPAEIPDKPTAVNYRDTARNVRV